VQCPLIHARSAQLGHPDGERPSVLRAAVPLELAAVDRSDENNRLAAYPASISANTIGTWRASPAA
jgi:hypothetical protein